MKHTSTDLRKQEIRISRNTGIWINDRIGSGFKMRFIVIVRTAEQVGDLRLAGFLTLDFEQDGVPLPAVYLSDEMASEPAGPRRIDHCSSRRWFHG